MKSVKHIAYSSLQPGPDDRQATFTARLLTSVIATSLFILAFFQLSDPLAMPQKAGIDQIPVDPIENAATPLKKEPRWVIMTVPSSAWKIHLEKPEPTIKQVKEEPKPENVKLKEKPKTKEKPITTPRKKVTKSVGSAKQAPNINGAGQTNNEMSNALQQIVEIIEKNKRYPKRARDIGMEGQTVLIVNIDDSGTVTDYRLRDGGNALFRRATLSAAQSLKGVKTQVRRASILKIPVRYEIN